MTERKIIIEEVGKPTAPPEPKPSRYDLQDYLVMTGIVSGEVAAVVIWWPAAFILASLFSFGFAYLIERSNKKPKANRGNS